MQFLKNFKNGLLPKGIWLPSLGIYLYIVYGKSAFERPDMQWTPKILRYHTIENGWAVKGVWSAWYIYHIHVHCRLWLATTDKFHLNGCNNIFSHENVWEIIQKRRRFHNVLKSNNAEESSIVSTFLLVILALAGCLTKVTHQHDAWILVTQGNLQYLAPNNLSYLALARCLIKDTHQHCPWILVTQRDFQ